MNKRVLIIVTSNAKLGDTGKTTGIWVEELAVPYYAFIDAGFTLEFASPKGGAVPFDPASIKPKGQNGTQVERFLADAEAQRRCAATRVAAHMDAAGFDAIFFPGGHGAMWDLPTDQGVTLAVEAAYRANKIIAAVCHGPAGLVTAKRPDGKSILHGKRINAFTDEEVKAIFAAHFAKHLHFSVTYYEVIIEAIARIRLAGSLGVDARETVFQFVLFDHPKTADFLQLIE